MSELIISMFIGFIIGYVVSHKSDKEVSDLMDTIERNQKETDITIKHYKKLCKTLAEENSEFRRKL